MGRPPLGGAPVAAAVAVKFHCARCLPRVVALVEFILSLVFQNKPPSRTVPYSKTPYITNIRKSSVRGQKLWYSLKSVSSRKGATLLILLDQDGVLADFEGRFLELWRERYPNEMYVPREARRFYELTDEYPRELKEAVLGVYESEGFFLSLPPIPGALAGAKALMELGHDIRICTSPISRYEHCVR